MRNIIFAVIGIVAISTIDASATERRTPTKEQCELIWGSCTMQCVSADVTNPNSMLLCNVVCVDGTNQNGSGPLAPEGHE